MDPLATYLLTVLKNERTNATRAYREAEEALEELGYWLLERPVEWTRDQMPKCNINTECDLVDCFPSHVPSFGIFEGFDVVVDVYADPDTVDRVT